MIQEIRFAFIFRKKLVIIFLVVCSTSWVRAQQQQPKAFAGKFFKAKEIFNTPNFLKMDFSGIVGERLKANLEYWELPTPIANPALTAMFSDRNRLPSRNLLPWSGEFVGKYLSASILSYRILRDPRQKVIIQKVALELINSQDVDGYLGPFDQQNRLIGKNWDIWGNYWAIKSLLLYYDEFGNENALASAKRAADLLVDRFLNKDFHFTNDGNGASNYAVIHAFTDLYGRTGRQEYLAMANWIVKEWELPVSNQYLTKAMQGYGMHQLPNNGNRWESIHDLLGMYDMYLITGEKKYLDAFSLFWKGIQTGDRHNTGGFTSGEVATGNPYLTGPIETCCTVAWIDMCVHLLRSTGNAVIVDELELSLYNGLLGGQHPSGRWWTYNTPMDGTKEASAHSINFQCRAGSPELNCCSVNGPRGLGLLSEWAVLSNKESVVINYYGASRFNLLTPGQRQLNITQVTDYPKSGDISITINPSYEEQFNVMVRIPSWSEKTAVKVNGVLRSGCTPGSYLIIKKKWKKGDRIDITFDMSPHYWVGEREMAGKTSVYYGPLLLAFDPRYNSMDPDPSTIPALNTQTLELKPLSPDKKFTTWVVFQVKGQKNEDMILCDFASAGLYGNYYLSWLNVEGVSNEGTSGGGELKWNYRNSRK